MKYKQGKSIIIAVLCCLIVLMGVGFAILSTQLVINGSGNIIGQWDIYIESITPIEEGYTGVSSSAFVNQNDKTKASFTADLKKPRDFVEYNVVVKNNGNIDAKLTEVLLEDTVSHKDVKFSHTAPEGEVLYAGDTTEFTIKVEFLESATTVEKISVSSSIKLNYEQYDPSDISGDEGMGVPGGPGVEVEPSTIVMATLNDDDTVNLLVSEYVLEEDIDIYGAELYTSSEYDGEYTLVGKIPYGSSINVEKSKFNEFYKIRFYTVENGTEVYTDYSEYVALRAQTPVIESAFAGAEAETGVSAWGIYNANEINYDGIEVYYSVDGLSYDYANLDGNEKSKLLRSDSAYYPPSGETYYYKLQAYLDLNGVLIYSDLSEAITITNEN